MKRLLSLALLLSMTGAAIKSASLEFDFDRGLLLNDAAVFAGAGASYARRAESKDEVGLERAARFAGRFVVVNYGTEVVDPYAQAAVEKVPGVSHLLGGDKNALRRLLVALAVGEAANYAERGASYAFDSVSSKLHRNKPTT